MGILCAFALTGGVIAAYAEDENGASANGGGTQLFLPTSYEQYLDLKSPSDFAVNDDYIAIADGSKIYLYDKGAEKYEVFSHTDGSTLSSLNFYGEDGKTYLYFVDNNTNVYSIDCASFATTDAATSTGFTCASFIIDGNNFYYGRTTDGATVYKTTVSIGSLTEGTQIEKAEANITPYFSMSDGVVYFSLNSKIYSIKNGMATQNPWDLTMSITAFIVAGDQVYYSTTSTDKDFYLYEDQGSSPVIYKGETVKGVPSVKMIGDAVWFVDQDTGRGCIRTLTPHLTENGSYRFNDYEIGKYSKSETRLGANAAELSVYNEKLLIADTENNRVLHYTRNADGTYLRNAPVSLSDISPDLVCAGENAFAVADGRELRILSYVGEELYRETFTGDVTSIAYSYGCFYVSINGQSLLYEYAPAADTASYEETDHTLFSFVPEYLTADIYGNLYALQATSVRRLKQDYSVDTSFTMSAPAGTQKLLSDFAGNLYALSADTAYLLKEKETPAAIFSSQNINGLVYSDSTISVLSFAFGFENGDAFILSDGFIVKTDALSVRSLTELDAEGVYGNVFSSPSQSSKAKLLTAKAGAVTVGLDLSELSDGVQYLPYHGYERLQSEKTGVVLAETDDGTIVAFYDRTDRSYSFALVLSGSPAEVIDTGVQTSASGTMYTVSEIGLYKYPLMLISAGEDGANRFESIRVGRSHTVKLLAKISHDALDAKYYFVSVTEGGTEYFGFLPKVYLSDYNSAGAHNPSEFRYARIDKGESCVLKNTVTGEENIFENREKLKVFDKRKDENGNVYVIYEGDEGTYTGYVDPDILYEATPAVMVTLVIVTIAAAAIIVSVCYLLLRKQPTLQ